MLIYLITNLVNGKKYAGQTSQSLDKRWKRHQYPLNHRRHSYLYNAICKYGKDNFSVEPVVVVHTKQDLDFYESFLIREFDLKNPEKGYNLTDGGGGMIGFKLSDETKEKMSKHVKSEEHCKKISQSKMGNKARLGMKHSEETKQKMSQKAKGRIFSTEHLRNLSIAAKKRREREEQ